MGRFLCKLVLALLPCLWLLLSVSVVWAEDRWVRRSEIKVREGQGTAYKVLATYRKGDRVNVVGTDEKNVRWLKVDVGGGKTGWAHEDGLSERRIDPRTGQVVGDASASGLSTSAAASGAFDA